MLVFEKAATVVITIFCIFVDPTTATFEIREETLLDTRLKEATTSLLMELPVTSIRIKRSPWRVLSDIFALFSTTFTYSSPDRFV